MSQHSEERSPLSVEVAPSSARILPFERPQSELQKAVQQRAQQAIELERSRENRPPQVARWLIGTLVAILPVIVLLGGLDGFLRVFHKINEAYATMPMPEAPPAAAEPEQDQPGVVMLRPMESLDRPRADAAKPAASGEKN